VTLARGAAPRKRQAAIVVTFRAAAKKLQLDLSSWSL
jgi:hypothetical protein